MTFWTRSGEVLFRYLAIQSFDCSNHVWLADLHSSVTNATAIGGSIDLTQTRGVVDYELRSVIFIEGRFIEWVSPMFKSKDADDGNIGIWAQNNSQTSRLLQRKWIPTQEIIISLQSIKLYHDRQNDSLFDNDQGSTTFIDETHDTNKTYASNDYENDTHIYYNIPSYPEYTTRGQTPPILDSSRDHIDNQPTVPTKSAFWSCIKSYRIRYNQQF